MGQGEAACISFGGKEVDARVSEETLRVVEPGAINAALLAADEVSSSHDDLITMLEIELKEARYVADRACKRYEAVDPLNRLVADELESRWNAALVRVGELEQRIELERSRKRPQSVASRGQFLNLARDLAAVWNDPNADVRLKKRIVRTVINEIVVDLDESANQIALTIHWAGGVHTELRVLRRRRGVSRETPEDVVDAVRSLARVCGDEMIAGLLNKNGIRTVTGTRWNQARVGSLRWRNDIPGNTAARRVANGWMTLKDASALLGIAPLTLREIAADHPLPNGPWTFTRESLADPKLGRLATGKGAQKGGKPLPGQRKLLLFDT
jgi:hypothetical protein